MKILPIGFQHLSEFQHQNAIYVDKTDLVHRLTMQGKYYFLSRPRRFGKSLLVSTLQELFEGNKTLFQGLWIEEQWDWSQKYPVIHISFASLSYEDDQLAVAISEELSDIAEKHHVPTSKKLFKDKFKELIVGLHQKYQQKVVILIDEYDKPIVDYLEETPLRQAKKNQKILKNFYSGLKDLGNSIRFLFITGVSKFSKVSLFSDLNHLADITLHKDYATLTGYTQQELESYFPEYLRSVATELNLSPPQLLAEMKKWYNGYSWDGETKVYNPFGTLNFLSHRHFQNFWFATGTPTFLLRQIKRFGQFEVENIAVDISMMEKYDLDNIGLIQLLFQTGYLTMQSRQAETMVLDYPNKEVRDSMYKFLLHEIAPSLMTASMGVTLPNLKNAFETHNLIRVQTIIDSLLADLPEETFRKSSEGLYHGLLHILFKYLGTVMESEVHSSKGRADVVVQTLTHIYIFEFKINQTAEIAFQQIVDNEYADKYRAANKPILAIGVNFNTKKRKMDTWKQDFL